MCPDFHRNCWERKRSGEAESKVYQIKPGPGGAFNAYCDQSPLEGGWTVILRRFDGSENFNRSFQEYVYGFGVVTSEFWLGLEHIAELTEVPSELLIELKKLSGDRVYAYYRRFQVSHGAFRLSISYYTGTAGDALGALDQTMFSAAGVDVDEDPIDCAHKYSSGWWYKTCTGDKRDPDLNGPYPSGIYWMQSGAITEVIMKVRPAKGYLSD